MKEEQHKKYSHIQVRSDRQMKRWFVTVSQAQASFGGNMVGAHQISHKYKIESMQYAIVKTIKAFSDFEITPF